MTLLRKKGNLKLSDELIAQVNESLKNNPPFTDKIERAKAQMLKYPVPKTV